MKKKKRKKDEKRTQNVYIYMYAYYNIILYSIIIIIASNIDEYMRVEKAENDDKIA